MTHTHNICMNAVLKPIAQIVVSGFLGLSATTASATNIHYDFQASPDNTGHDAIQLTVGGLAVTVTAWTEDVSFQRAGLAMQVTSAMGSFGGDNAGVYYGSSGLGVFLGNSDDSFSMDGADFTSQLDRPEALLFTFDRVVELTHINFANWSATDYFALIAQTNFGPINQNFMPAGYQSIQNNNGGNDQYYASHFGNRFWVWALDDADSFRIQDIDVQIPEPETLYLFGLGFALISANRMRRDTKH